MGRKFAITAVVLIALVIGLAAGVGITARGYEKFVVAPARNQTASLAAMRVEILSQLRLGNEEQAVKTLEVMLDTETMVLTQNPPDQRSELTSRVLKQIKAYRNLYPPQGAGAQRVISALADTPALTDYKKECKAGLCQLLEREKTPASAPAATSPAE